MKRTRGAGRCEGERMRGWETKRRMVYWLIKLIRLIEFVGFIGFIELIELNYSTLNSRP